MKHGPDLVAEPPPARSSAPDPAAELTILRRAQMALERQPGEALQLAERHAATHPSGVFAQERELIAIEALMKLQRRHAAEARAQAFIIRFPRSAHRRRLGALVGIDPEESELRPPGREKAASPVAAEHEGQRK